MRDLVFASAVRENGIFRYLGSQEVFELQPFRADEPHLVEEADKCNRPKEYQKLLQNSVRASLLSHLLTYVGGRADAMLKPGSQREVVHIFSRITCAPQQCMHMESLINHRRHFEIPHLV